MEPAKFMKCSFTGPSNQSHAQPRGDACIDGHSSPDISVESEVQKARLLMTKVVLAYSNVSVEEQVLQ